MAGVSSSADIYKANQPSQIIKPKNQVTNYQVDWCKFWKMIMLIHLV